MKLEHIVAGMLKIGLVCSALYFGARHSQYILGFVDGIKEKYFPQEYAREKQTSFAQYQKKLLELRASDPVQYNAVILTDFWRDSHVYRTQNPTK
ncbi:MAG TPA: hypothetical protein VK158_00755 [Acidobacteriota bacterium]|nr:hypothetical protein [Acidobacteriota bacterium]